MVIQARQYLLVVLPGRRPQIVHPGCLVEVHELAERSWLDGVELGEGSVERLKPLVGSGEPDPFVLDDLVDPAVFLCAAWD
jgi:hypothetical protein